VFFSDPLDEKENHSSPAWALKSSEDHTYQNHFLRQRIFRWLIADKTWCLHPRKNLL